ncbi:CpsD/CapB family tyrosine-protein kinase [Sphingomonas panacisoli]|uniref:CpsD/CapB family tyrosine-protein kinase n=1 Tax=Sphingomonas panacisoli TaxID=1813879 RepID=A0A5B8LJJ1_9SPHN|nr:CpsD/CapB family tyrosine-protein kinase [Sphingomonas panacisoli]QDZ08039.1 CpsD/CapB family tyrosine-protein kinase [Sphingomonas panacisoli]
MTDSPIAPDMGAANASGVLTTARPLFQPADPLAKLNLSREMLDDQRIVGFNNRDRRSRAYHLLRAQVTKIMKRNNWRMIGVTSATPDAGKTFTSINLAAALAATAGTTVVLADLDLRRGSIWDTFGNPTDKGLSDYLEGKIDNPRDIACRINESKLVIVPTIRSEAPSSELLASDRFRSFIEQLRAMPQDVLMIFDLPPVFADDDAIMCMEYLDAYLLVVDHGVSTARQIEETVRLLHPAPCLGTVLNRYKGGFADPYGYGYGDRYGMKSYD